MPHLQETGTSMFAAGGGGIRRWCFLRYCPPSFPLARQDLPVGWPWRLVNGWDGMRLI